MSTNLDLSDYVDSDGRLTIDGSNVVALATEILSKASFLNSKGHGWYEELITKKIAREDDFGNNVFEEALLERNFGEVCALITSEISEALESYRNAEAVLWYNHKDSLEKHLHTTLFINPDTGKPGKAEGVAAEFADAIIRIHDFCGAYGVPLAEAIVNKHLYNYSRPYRHGGKAM